jgi:hypothetical protein
VPSTSASRGASLVLGFAIGTAVLFVVAQVVSLVVSAEDRPRAEALMTLGWVAVSVVLAAGVLLLASGRESPGLAWFLVALIGVGALLLMGRAGLSALAPSWDVLLRLLAIASWVVTLAERVALFFFLVRCCPPGRSWVPVVALVAGLAVAVRTGLSLVLMTGLLGYQLLRSPLYGLTISGLNVVLVIATIVLALAVRASVAARSTG